MTSTIKLYFIKNFTQDKLFKIDDLSSFLGDSRYSSLIYTNNTFQYVKHNLTLDIKLDLSQTEGQPFTTPFNYVAIKNTSDEEKECFYFVNNVEWRGQSTIKVNLSMDTLNSFSDELEFDDKTKILREHKDRFTLIGEHSIDVWENKRVVTYVGTLPRGVIGRYWFKSQLASATQYPVAFHSATAVYFLNTETYEQIRFYSNVKAIDIRLQPNYFIFYDNDGNIIEKYRQRDDELVVLAMSSSNYISNIEAQQSSVDSFLLSVGGSIEKNRYTSDKSVQRNIDFYSEGVNPQLYGVNLGEIREKYDYSWYLVYGGETQVNCYLCSDIPSNIITSASNVISADDLEGGKYYYVLDGTLQSANGNAYAYRDYTITGNVPQYYRDIICFWKDLNTIKFKTLHYLNDGAALNSVSEETTIEDGTMTLLPRSEDNYVNVYPSTSYIEAYSLISGITPTILDTTEHNYTIGGISDVDRYEANLIKIIQLPYLPDDFVIDENRYIHVNNKNWTYDSEKKLLKLSNLQIPFKREIQTEYNPLSELDYMDISDVHTNDTRNKKYESKLFHSDYYLPKFIYDSFSFAFRLECVNLTNYYPAPFKFEFKATNTINSRFLFTFNKYNCEGKITEDYYNILPVARNNEIVIYKDSYTDYIKTGYNYDVKTKDRQVTANWLGLGLSTAGSIASAVTGNVLGIGLAVSTGGKIISAINSQRQAEQNIQQKLAQAKLQSASVSGSDDVDLMNSYANNSAKFMLYKVSEKMEQTLFDLFYYTGYVADRLGIPNTTNRIWFNYIQCEPVFNLKKHAIIGVTDTAVWESIIENIKAKYQVGVTIIHKFDNEWNIEQTYENWETILHIGE